MKALCDGERCSQCGQEVAAGVRRSCPAYVRTAPAIETPPPPEKLGDWTERQLEKIGVTPERYAEAKAMFGLSPTCNCKERKEFLNRVSDWWRGVS